MRHHFIFGGIVKGNRFYDDIQKYELGHAQDAGSGRLISQIRSSNMPRSLENSSGYQMGSLIADSTLHILMNFTQKGFGFMNGSVIV